MKIANVKGGYDYGTKTQAIRDYINDTLREIFREYGYNHIETAILCYYDMLASKYDEDNDILKEIYRLTDQGERELALRYDLTVPFAKFIAINKNDIKLPFKRYEIAKVFRDGPVKVGRDREFTQCDVDVVGIDGQVVEAELLSLYDKAFKKLDIPIIIKYNNRKLMRGIIKELGIDDELIASVITVIDKKDKITEKEFKDSLIKLGIQDGIANNLIESFSYSFGDLQDKYSDTSNMEIKEGLEEISNLMVLLEELEINQECVFTSTLARGQDYYTGNVFEVYEKNGKIAGSIGGGGRYDKMITEFIDDGETYPAVGISFGLTGIYELLRERDDLINDAMVDIYIIPINTDNASLKLANTLRNMGFKVDLEMNKRKLKKALLYADREMIPYVIVLGEDEIANGTFKVRDMHNGVESEISFNNILEIKEIINKI